MQIASNFWVLPFIWCLLSSYVLRQQASLFQDGTAIFFFFFLALQHPFVHKAVWYSLLQQLTWNPSFLTSSISIWAPLWNWSKLQATENVIVDWQGGNYANIIFGWNMFYILFPVLNTKHTFLVSSANPSSSIYTYSLLCTCETDSLDTLTVPDFYTEFFPFKYPVFSVGLLEAS